MQILTLGFAVARRQYVWLVYHLRFISSRLCQQIEEYTKLITDAAIDELQRYDVILCTCAASASPRMVRGANVRQLVIDEGGMCMEPECLVPLRAFKAVKQVVVIGDHRQLQPIVMDSVAKDRGLDISLFERYKDQAIMLTHQYRMVGIRNC